MKLSLKSQSLTEVALIIGVLGLVLTVMYNYATRGIQGKVKGLTDNIIGTEQSVYQQDTSGLEVNTSDSSLSQQSRAVLRSNTGGGRQLTSTEVTENVSTYESKGR